MNIPVIPASYIIYIDSDTNTIKAKNGTTGAIDYSGSDAATVIQDTLNALTSGGSVFIRKASSQYSINQSISLPSNITIDSDFATLRDTSAGTYKFPVNDVNFPPIFYNKNYNAGRTAYSQDSNITIRNLVFQGRGGGGVGTHNGSIPIRLAGTDDVRIEGCVFDNITLATGSANHQMAQAAIGVDLYNARTSIIKCTFKGGWNGIYLSGVNNVSVPTGNTLPTIAAGANLETLVDQCKFFNTTTAGGYGSGNSIAPAFCMQLVITSCHFVSNTNDNVLDLSGVDGAQVVNITIRGLTSTQGRAFNLGSNASRDIFMANVRIYSMLKAFGIQQFLYRMVVVGASVKAMGTSSTGIDVVGTPTEDVYFIGCDFTGATTGQSAANSKVHAFLSQNSTSGQTVEIANNSKLNLDGSTGATYIKNSNNIADFAVNNIIAQRYDANSAYTRGIQKVGAPVAGDSYDGYLTVLKDTGTGNVWVIYNDGGTLKKVQLT